MSQVGFVYILTNDYMDDVYKVGCTERSPHERAAELSKHTGVPHPFDVLCYIEIADFQRVEKAFHHWLERFRINENREFFYQGLDVAVQHMFWHPDRLAFCCPGRFGASELIRSIPFEGKFVANLSEIRDPWAATESVEGLEAIDFTGSEI